MPFGIGHPPPTHQLQSTCVGEGSRVPNLQTEFNYLNSFKSYGIFSDFVVPTWSPSSSCRPIIPTSSLSSPYRPRHPHVVPIAPRRSQCGLYMLSPSSPRRPHHPRVVPVIPTLSRRSPHDPQPPRYQLHPPPTPHPPGGWGSRISKNAIRFELITVFSLRF